ncbi:DUF898 domain-containing protein [Pontibacter sp. KCTC 32443]|uniref:YjgN family protein n=1 Tax=Pontibacter TaxID=323449 RepID=UPI00164D4D08|nr:MULTISPECIES: DUF898 family protein [Pontibacter]MBC5775211.1 DUF898 domain-containing protein [Pontibacter sp. KCTC 32443]
MHETSTLKQETTVTNPTLAFKGQGSELFSIQIVNIALMLVTLGLYYPWAKAKNLQYIYRKTELAGSPFTFHGTGKEMFIGFIKGLGIFAVLIGVFMYGYMHGDNGVKFLCFAAYFIGILALIPLAIHGMMRYRTSRTSWRGIHMGYRGTLGNMYKVYFTGFFLSVITLGIYGFWFETNLRKEILGNTRFGNAKFRFIGDGSDLLLVHIKGYFLTVITFGIYGFWYMKDLIHFYINNILIEQDGKYSRLDSSLTGGQYFKLAVGNLLIMIFTLGLGYAWVVTRTMAAIFNNCEILGEFNPDALAQTEEDYKNATFEDMADMLDIGLV